MSRRVILIAFLAATACSDSGHPATAGTDAAVGGSGGAAGVGGSGGTGGLPRCFQLPNAIVIAVEPPPFDEGINDWELTGAVTAEDKNSFTIDTCAPSTGCAPSLTTFTVDARRAGVGLPLDVGLQVGAYVRVRYQTYGYNMGEIGTQLAVANLPSWDGKQNPVSTSDVWEFFATEGALLQAEMPFEVDSRPLDCAPEGEGTIHKLRVRAAAGAPWTELLQNESTTLNTNGQKWLVSVVRAFQYNGYDGPSPFAWWASASPQ